MRSNKNKQRLKKIIYNSERIESLVKRAVDYDTFVNDDAFYSSISMREMQIGEHSSHLTTEFLEKSKDIIPWKQIRAMRNMFAHEYDEMLSRIIWDTAVYDVPILKSFCENYLKENESEE